MVRCTISGGVRHEAQTLGFMVLGAGIFVGGVVMTLTWPLVLVVIGLVCIAVGAFKIHPGFKHLNWFEAGAFVLACVWAFLR